MSVNQGCAERRQVSACKILWRNLCTEAVPQWFRAAVGVEMFGRGHHFQIFRIIPLQSGHEGHTKLRGEEWVFAVSLLATAPAWIADDIEVRDQNVSP